jgi:C1A family cysteine protease
LFFFGLSQNGLRVRQFASDAIQYVTNNIAFSTNKTRDSTDVNVWRQFNYFQNTYRKEYDTLVELERRFQIFAENFRVIVSHNSNPNRTFTLNINRFTDLTPEEFQATYVSGYIGAKNMGSFGCKTFSSIEYPEFVSADAVPDSVDWREKRVVNSVRDQEQCGSCWAFATTANAESAWAIATGKLLDLSEQYLVDCATGFGYFNMGCNGGQPDSAMKYMIQNGQCVETEYPYYGKDSECGVCANAGVKFAACYDVVSKDQQALKSAVAMQPVVVAIEADTRYFQSYSSGILDASTCGTNLDHAVEVVGYGVDGGKKYWTVRNSWGESWGENGYVRILRSDSTNDAGVCGISSEPSFLAV